ncbi:MAG: hypothetical protein U0795_14565 [Pirellulales bacterium]
MQVRLRSVIAILLEAVDHFASQSKPTKMAPLAGEKLGILAAAVQVVGGFVGQRAEPVVLPSWLPPG